MNKYSDTLNLPKTSFPMRAALASRETSLVKDWQEQNIYQKIQNHLKKNPRPSSFVLHDGPPYANGKIHIGHAVNKILKDIIVKARLMNNQSVCYIPGWDCHGLPIEMQIEKKHGKVGKKYTAAEFRHRCREFADQQIAQQKEDFLRLGVIGDWTSPYKTKDYYVEANEILALKDLYKKGFIRLGLKPVYWSTGCESALAEAEIEYHNKNSLAIDVYYPVKDSRACLALFGIEPPKEAGSVGAVIWTTTPWTLPASQAIALHPDLEYALVKGHKEGETLWLILAKDLVTACADRYKLSLTLISTKKGSQLEGLVCLHPFYTRDVPMVLGDHVTIDSGTGCVHTAPAHGPEDFVVGQKYGLDLSCPVNEKGVYYDDVALFGGLFVGKAEKIIVEKLKEKSVLLACESFNHSYPHCWRTKTPLIFRATTQWFIRLQGVIDDALSALSSVNFYPYSGRERMKGMLNNRPDWCISRQRYWGVPIPFITHKQSKEVHPNMLSIIDEIAGEVREKGINAWFDRSLESLVGVKDAEHYEKCQDVLDVWFDSGMTHYTLQREKEGLTFPADLYLEGSDQHRGWFQSSLLTAIALNNQPPYKGVLTHGFTVDQHGKKMSKSEGNIVEPQKICQTLGADILRLWVASSDYRQEMSVSDEIFKRVSDAYRRIRNTIRYFLGNINDFDDSRHLVNFSQQLSIDRWAVHRANVLQKEIITAYENYEFHLICKKIQHFCSIEMGAFYLDILKDRLYTCQKNSLARRSAQTTLYHLCHAMVRWLCPILFFTSDEIWQELRPNKEDELLFQTWYQGLSTLPDNEVLNASYWNNMQKIKSCVDKSIETLRKNNDVGSSLDVQTTLYAEPKLFEQLSLLGDELRFVFITSYAHLKPIKKAPKNVAESLEGLKIISMPCPFNRCERSWHRREEVGTNPQYPDLDSRSILNAYGEGESRYFV